MCKEHLDSNSVWSALFQFAGPNIKGGETYLCGDGAGTEPTLTIPPLSGRCVLAATDCLYHGAHKWTEAYRFVLGLYVDIRVLNHCLWNRLTPVNYTIENSFTSCALELSTVENVQYRTEAEWKRLSERKEELKLRLLFEFC